MVQTENYGATKHQNNQSFVDYLEAEHRYYADNNVAIDLSFFIMGVLLSG
jgi:hypothetical protein